LIDQSLISTGTPLVGGLLGFVTGFAIKKITKLAFITIGLLSLFLGYLEYKHWILVNWTVAENQPEGGGTVVEVAIDYRRRDNEKVSL